MAFREIAMIVVSLILVGILGLSVAPSITASGDATKTSVVASEFETIIKTSKMWMTNNSIAGDFTGINAASMSNILPTVAVEISGATSAFVSKVDSNIKYKIISATTSSTNDSIEITISGLTSIADIEAALKTSLSNMYGSANITDSVVNDGILIVKIKG